MQLEHPTTVEYELQQNFTNRPDSKGEEDTRVGRYAVIFNGHQLADC